MANLRPKKKGDPPNPGGGRPPEPPEFKLIKRLTKDELAEIGNLVIKNDIRELERLANDKYATVIKVMIASVAAKVIRKGDMAALDLLLNRLVGKVRDEVHVENTGAPTQIIVTLPANGREAKKVNPP